ncbi:MAG: plasmid pRiA4b ORF-3 family protein, partial [Saprospiraceae bacterium]
AIEIEEGHFTFKITSPYHTKFWRTVKVDANHTLHDLHNIIQEAIQFDNDHLYSFYLDNKPYSKKGYHSPHAMQSPVATSVCIGDLGFREGQRILYLFDYGDSWEFTIELVKQESAETSLPQAVLVGSKGEAPEQYPGWGEEDY